jgi:hypothetical protein
MPFGVLPTLLLQPVIPLNRAESRLDWSPNLLRVSSAQVHPKSSDCAISGSWRLSYPVAHKISTDSSQSGVAQARSTDADPSNRPDPGRGLAILSPRYALCYTSRGCPSAFLNWGSMNLNHPPLSIRATAILTVLAVSILIAGCVGSATSTTPTKPPPVPTVTSVMVSCTPATVTLGATAACSAVVSGTNESQQVTWTATNGTVTSAGVFTPTATGTAVVTATSTQDVSKSGTASVTVNSPVPTVTSVAVTCNPATISVGGTAACTAIVSGTNSPSQAVTWSAMNGSVSASGVLTPNATGTAVVTATSVQDATKSGIASVTVTAPPPTVSSVTASCVPATVVLGASTACSAVVTGTGNPSQAVTWTSANGAVTAVGGFTPSALGTAVITATSVLDSTKSGSASVVVTPSTSSVTNVAVNCAPSTIQFGSTTMCTAIVSGANSPTQSVRWSATAGTISASGVHTAPAVMAQTQVIVTATSTLDATKSGTFTVTVNPPTPTAIGIGDLGGLMVVNGQVIVAEQINNVVAVLAQGTDGTWTTESQYAGTVAAMRDGEVLTVAQTDNVFLNGVEQFNVITQLPPTLYQHQPAWFDLDGVIRTPQGPVFTPTQDQDGIDIQGDGSILTWIEESLSGTPCQVWASVAGAQPLQVSNETTCAAGVQPLDVGEGHLFLAWSNTTAIQVAESLDGGGTWSVTAVPNGSPLGPTSPRIAFGGGVVYVVWQQKGDPQTVDDVTQGWGSQRVSGVWTAATVLPPGGSASAGNFDPTVAADGSTSLRSYEQPKQGGPGIFLDATLIGTASGPGNPLGPLLALLPDGARVVAWSDGQVWVDEVPR